MGICGASSLTKNERSQNKNKNITISIIYNDEPKKECLINKNVKLMY